MIIVGGTYVERCEFPYWNRIFGSGLRAAIALSSISAKCSLYTYVNNLWSEDVIATLETFGIAPHLLSTEEKISFDYLYGFENVTRLDPQTIRQSPTFDVDSEVVLRFGMLEGNARVKGNRVVFDPQYAQAGSFLNNGSEAESLALILNADELVRIGISDWPEDRDPSTATDEQRREAAQNIFDVGLSHHLVIIVKHGVGGADVYVNDESPTQIPAYAANAFFKIGSGDVFSAAFAYAWGERRMHVLEAAKYASLCSAYYIEDGQLPLLPPEGVQSKPEVGRRQTSGIALSGLASEANAELLRHAENSLRRLGGSVDLRLIAPQGDLFEVGSGDVVLALFDRHATSTDIVRLRSRVGDRRLVVFWPSPLGSTVPIANTLISKDYATALYLALREARR